MRPTLVYRQSIGDRTAAQGTGAFRNGQTTGSAYADFDQGVDVINSYGPGRASTSRAARRRSRRSRRSFARPKLVHFASLNAPYPSLPVTRSLLLPSRHSKNLYIPLKRSYMRIARQTHGTSPQVWRLGLV
jgi:hypothetical protein